MAKLTY